MRPKTNSAATRDTIRVLQAEGRLGPEDAGNVQLALSTAKALDEALTDRAGKKYVVAQLARAHQLALGTLLQMSTPTDGDAFDEFMKMLSVPTRPEDDHVPGFEDYFPRMPDDGNGRRLLE